jgi:hypothetical protein
VIKLRISGSIDPVVVLISAGMQEADDRGSWHSSSVDLDGPVVVMLDDGSTDGFGAWISPMDKRVFGQFVEPERKVVRPDVERWLNLSFARATLLECELHDQLRS